MQWEEEFGFSNSQEPLLITFYMIRENEEEIRREGGRNEKGSRKTEESKRGEKGEEEKRGEGEEKKRGGGQEDERRRGKEEERKNEQGWREEWQLKIWMDDIELGTSEHYVMLKREEGELEFTLPTCLRLKVVNGRDDQGERKITRTRRMRGMTYCKDKFGKLFEQEKIGGEEEKGGGSGAVGGGKEGIRRELVEEDRRREEGQGKGVGKEKRWKFEMDEKIEKEVYALLLRRYFLLISDYSKNEDFLLFYFFYLQKTGREQDMTLFLSKTQAFSSRLLGKKVRRWQAINFLNDIIDFMLSEKNGGDGAAEEGRERKREGRKRGKGTEKPVKDAFIRSPAELIQNLSNPSSDLRTISKDKTNNLSSTKAVSQVLSILKAPEGNKTYRLKRLSDDRDKIDMEVALRNFKAEFFGFKDNQVLRNFTFSDSCPEDFVCLMSEAKALNLSEIDILDESK